MTNSIFSSRTRQYIPLILAILVTGAYLIFFEFGLLKSTGNVLIYPLDDPYIHMQVARNLAIHGVLQGVQLLLNLVLLLHQCYTHLYWPFHSNYSEFML